MREKHTLGSQYGTARIDRHGSPEIHSLANLSMTDNKCDCSEGSILNRLESTVTKAMIPLPRSTTSCPG